MRFELTGRHVDITPALRRLVEGKLAKLERMLNDSAVSAQAVLTREKHRRRADITLHARGEKFLHGVGNSAAWEASVAQAIEKITQQAQRVKGKWQERKRRGAKEKPLSVESAEAAAPAEHAAPQRRERARMPPIFRASRRTVRPMTVADAARALTGDGDGIVVFRDLETSSVSVLYRAPSGEVTLVQTDDAR